MAVALYLQAAVWSGFERLIGSHRLDRKSPREKAKKGLSDVVASYRSRVHAEGTASRVTA